MLSTRSFMRLLAALALGAFALRPPLRAQSPVPENEVKAAFLFNIAKFAQWPAEAFTGRGAPLIIGVLGTDPFGPALDRLVRGRSLNGRPVVVRRAERGAELRDAQLVFLGNSESERAQQLAAAFEAANILCVGDSSQTEPFTAVSFSVSAGRIVFTVNLAAARRANVKISSKLLNLATSVRGGSAPAPQQP